jgi:hypothetical protein
MKVLIWKSKHGDLYYDASTSEALRASALEILKMNFEVGWYPSYTHPDDSEWVKKPELSQEQIDDLPDGEIKEAAIKQAKDYHRSLAEFMENEKFLTQVRKSLEENDGDLALSLLKRRNGYEYECFDIETVWTGDKDAS